MSQINLTAVTGQELRQLLDSSRRQGDAALSYSILQEMADRRRAPAAKGLFKGRRPAEPRTIEVAFGDPLERDEIPPMPSIRLPLSPPDAEPAPAPERTARRKRPPVRTAPAATPLDHGRPLTLRDADPEPPPEADIDVRDSGLRMASAEPPKRRPRRGLPIQVAAGLVLGVALGTVVGWYVALLPRDPPPALAAAPVAVAPAVQAPAPAPEPVVTEVATAPEAALDAIQAATEPAPEPEAAAAAVEGEALELPAPPPLPAPAPRKLAVNNAPPREAAADSACVGAPTPADRVICGDPDLKRLQAELRGAYNAAVKAHQDRALLRERQLAWRDARNAVSDPNRLAGLYEARIRKLKAATAEALRER